VLVHRLGHAGEKRIFNLLQLFGILLVPRDHQISSPVLALSHGAVDPILILVHLLNRTVGVTGVRGDAMRDAKARCFLSLSDRATLSAH
jgi:hypothetical protein